MQKKIHDSWHICAMTSLISFSLSHSAPRNKSLVLPPKYLEFVYSNLLYYVSLFQPLYSPSWMTHDLLKHCRLSTWFHSSPLWWQIHGAPSATSQMRKAPDFPWWWSSKESICQRRGHRFDPGPGITHATGQLILMHLPLHSPCALETVFRKKRATQWEVHSPQLGEQPCSTTRKAGAATKTQHYKNK